MIKRLFNIARSNASHIYRQYKGEPDLRWTPPHEDLNFRTVEESSLDSMATYYANLEIAPGASREQIKAAWKRLMKQYHPDMHSEDPKKRETANELTRRLTEAYRILDKELAQKHSV